MRYSQHPADLALGSRFLPRYQQLLRRPTKRYDQRSGLGHMVGMSQYGARAMAEGGYTASQIPASLRHTPLRASRRGPASEFIFTDPDPFDRILQNRTSFNFRVDGAGPPSSARPTMGGSVSHQWAAAGETWEFRALGGGACQFFKAGVAIGNPGTCQAAITWDFAAGTKIFSIDNGRTYARGVIRIRPAGEGFHVVLEIGIEPYLYGLGEMPSDWHPQALQAQAIAARTYGVRQAIRYGPAENFDISRQTAAVPPVRTIVDQAMRLFEEADQSSEWVMRSATTGQVVTHRWHPTMRHHCLLRQFDRRPYRQQRRGPRPHDSLAVPGSHT